MAFKEALNWIQGLEHTFEAENVTEKSSRSKFGFNGPQKWIICIADGGSISPEEIQQSHLRLQRFVKDKIEGIQHIEASINILILGIGLEKNIDLAQGLEQLAQSTC